MGGDKIFSLTRAEALEGDSVAMGEEEAEVSRKVVAILVDMK